VKKFLCEGSLDLIIDVKSKKRKFLFTSKRSSNESFPRFVTTNNFFFFFLGDIETPSSKWGDLRIKMFSGDDLLSLANEYRAYEKLMDEQVHEVTFCYGTYFGPFGRKMVLLEDVKSIRTHFLGYVHARIM